MWGDWCLLFPIVQLAVAASAAAMCRRSAEAYAQVAGEGVDACGGVRADAAVNIGNALCTWAEHVAVKPFPGPDCLRRGKPRADLFFTIDFFFIPKQLASALRESS